MLPWSRPEPFGAWVRLDDRTLIAVDHALAAQLGVRASRVSERSPAVLAPRPLEVHVAVTSRCPVACAGCYTGARPDGEVPALETIRARLRELRTLGASTVAFGGGEPLTHPDLPEIAAEARALGLVPVMTTSGLGLTEARARELEGFAQINVSHDGVGEAYAEVRGWDGVRVAERAIGLLADAGVRVGVNLVLTRGTATALEATAARVIALGARELQLLRYKPQGRAQGPDYLARRLAPSQIEPLWPRIEALARRHRDLSIRIDCALVPLLAEGLLAAGGASLLEAFGVFGCEAARHLGALDVMGRLAPCSFTPASAERASGWDTDDELSRFRAYHASPPAPCADCALFAVCRGGCQVVSRAMHGAFRPDPECPRVRAHEALETTSP